MSKSNIPVRFTGQHFIIDKQLIRDAIGHADLRQKTLVLDIGAGTGSLTGGLSRYCKKVIAIEKDISLIRYLRNVFRDDPKIEVFADDFRNFCFPRYAFRVVSNIPYGITAFILKKLMFSNVENFKGGTIIMQYEAAKKLVLRSNVFNPLHILYQTFYTIQLVYEVKPESFLPPPTVASALVKISRKMNPPVLKGTKKKYLDFMSLMLKKPHRRSLTALKLIFQKKQVRILCTRYGINPDLPAVALSPSQWAGCFVLMLEQVPERYHP